MQQVSRTEDPLGTPMSGRCAATHRWRWSLRAA